jgi:hypothetical protein
MNELQKLETFKAELALAETFEEIKLHESSAAALAEFGRREGLAIDAQNNIGRFRVSVEAKKGVWLDENFPHGGDKPSLGDSNFEGNQERPSKMPTTKRESVISRTIADNPEKVFEAERKIEKAGGVVTPTGVYNEVSKEKKKERKAKTPPPTQDEKDEKLLNKNLVQFEKDINVLAEKVSVFESFIGTATKVDGERAWWIHSSLISMAARIESFMTRIENEKQKS